MCARRLIALILLTMLSGCGPVSFVKETPLRSQMFKITPGLSTKNDIRELLGEPLYSSTVWDAELYAGNVVRQRLLDVLFPIPVGTEFKPATLLVVYEPPGIVSGVAYNGDYGEPNCPNNCISGDIRGLVIQSLYVLLAPPAESALMVNITEPGDVCTLMVDATDEDLNAGIECRLYLDQRFLQLVTNNGYFRLGIPPGKHVLSCLTEGAWSQNLLPQVGHQLVPGQRTSVIDYHFDCVAGEPRYFTLKNQGGHFVGPVKCGIEPTDQADFLSHRQHPRLIIVPDSGGKTQ